VNKATVKDIEVNGKRVLMRVDFNVPVKDGVVTDDTRIQAALPTIMYLLDHNAKLILMSHRGRPKGKVVPEMNMDPVAKRLKKLLGKPVTKLDECIGEKVKKKVISMKPGDVILLENTRFNPGEKKNDPEFAKELASLGEIYVNDAFGTAHRSHASTLGVTKYIPVCVAGFLIEKELKELGKILTNPEKPFYAILGGAKVKDKIGVIDNLANICDGIIIGGGMAFTFLKAKGYEIGKSLLDPDLDRVRKIMDVLSEKKVLLALPDDVVVTDDPEGAGTSKIVDIDNIPTDMMGVDIGPKTIGKFSGLISKAKTIFWNGPMGIFEVNKFATGTRAIAQAVANMKGVSVIGGGDSVAAVKESGLSDKMTHISTGGGASLEFMEGKSFPGIEALTDKEKLPVVM